MMNQEFKALYKAAENLLNSDTKAQQVLVFRAGNIIYTFADHDIPSRYLRKALVKMNPENGKTKVLLRTFGGYTVKTLDEIG